MYAVVFNLVVAGGYAVPLAVCVRTWILVRRAA